MESRHAVQTKAVQAILGGTREVLAPKPQKVEKEGRSVRTYYMGADGRVSQRRGVLAELFYPRSRTCRASTTAQAVEVFRSRFPDMREAIHAKG